MVSVIMSVYNEEKVLEKKIKTVFTSNYPSNKLELVIGSDGSTDNTDFIIEKFIQEGYQIRFKKFGEKRKIQYYKCLDTGGKRTDIYSHRCKYFVRCKHYSFLVRHFKNER